MTPISAGTTFNKGSLRPIALPLKDRIWKTEEPSKDEILESRLLITDPKRINEESSLESREELSNSNSIGMKLISSPVAPLMVPAAGLSPDKSTKHERR